ncbi:MAG: PAS domain S-box protein [Alphaproteobacteria bacterium]|nr:PAS domain S-box protein [Alphaproteobacteria bacterium]
MGVDQVRHDALVRQALEAAPTGMLVVDEQGRIVIVNRHIEDLFGYARHELIGQRVEMLVPERVRAQHPNSRRAFFSAPEARPMGAGRDLYGVRKDGSEVPLEIGLNPLVVDDGTVTVASVVDITERRRMQARLEASLAETETLFRELHHRVKNNLQVVASLLSLQSRFTEDLTSVAVLREAQQRIHAIALVHEMLYRSETLTRVDFSSYLRNLTSHLTQATAQPSVVLDLDLDPTVALPVDLAVPCGLVVNELVTNALEHAFPDGRAGRIRVRLAREGSLVVVSVADDGIGMSPGLQPASARTMGLRLVATLARQLGSAVGWDVGNGTSATLKVEVE